jgi:hypothetical protein
LQEKAILQPRCHAVPQHCGTASQNTYGDGGMSEKASAMTALIGGEVKQTMKTNYLTPMNMPTKLNRSKRPSPRGEGTGVR